MFFFAFNCIVKINENDLLFEDCFLYFIVIFYYIAAFGFYIIINNGRTFVVLYYSKCYILVAPILAALIFGGTLIIGYMQKRILVYRTNAVL